MEILDPKTFKCTKCGECCRPIVKVDEDDINRIEKLGNKRDDFIQFDSKINSSVLKQKNNVCIFLERQGDEFVCSIYNNRPKVCQKYPFIKDEVKKAKARVKKKNSEG